MDGRWEAGTAEEFIKPACRQSARSAAIWIHARRAADRHANRDEHDDRQDRDDCRDGRGIGWLTPGRNARSVRAAPSAATRPAAIPTTTGARPCRKMKRRT